MITIYGSGLSTPANKVRVCAHALKIEHEYKEINLATGEHKKPEFLKINPVGKVPALQDGDFSLFESDAIIRYLGNLSDNELYPTDKRTRAQIDQWMCFATSHLMLSVSKMLYNTHFYKIMGVEKDERSLKEGEEWLNRYLTVLDQSLPNSLTLVDGITTLAEICCIVSLDPVDVIEFDLRPFSKVIELRQKIRESNFYQKVHSSYGATFENIVAAMR
jgi:glutathione S-transferase